MRVYYDEDGNYVGCNNTGHKPNGAVGFTYVKPTGQGMVFDEDSGKWCVNAEEKELVSSDCSENFEDIINQEPPRRFWHGKIGW